MWEDPVARFWERLIRQRAIEFMRFEPFLRSLRSGTGAADTAKRLQKRFGEIWAEYDTDIYKLIGSACGENWDMQNEEKCAAFGTKNDTAVNQENKDDDNLAGARETGTRERLDELQGVVEESECVLEEEKGGCEAPEVSGEEAQEKGGCEARGGTRSTAGSDYRRAGCT